MARNLVAWDPFREVSTMREDMERLFDSMLNRYPRERVQAVWAPSLDVEETNDAMIIRAELPGMKREDIKVTVAEDTVTISGERKYESEQPIALTTVPTIHPSARRVAIRSANSIATTAGITR